MFPRNEKPERGYTFAETLLLSPLQISFSHLEPDGKLADVRGRGSNRHPERSESLGNCNGSSLNFQVEIWFQKEIITKEIWCWVRGLQIDPHGSEKF